MQSYIRYLLFQKKEQSDEKKFPMETPARANTPTEPRSSAQVVRLQLIGGSLATYSPDQSLSETKGTARKVEQTNKGGCPSAKLLSRSSLELKSNLVTDKPPRKDSRIHLLPMAKDLSNKKHSYP